MSKNRPKNMLSKKRQIKFLRKNRKKITFHMRAFCDDKTKEDLHKMRVGIKKIRSFIYFLQKQISKKHLKNAAKGIKKIFKHAGLIRNAQVNLELATDFHIRNRNFREEQTETINIETDAFLFSHKTSIREVKRLFKHIIPHLKDVKKKRILKFFSSEIEKSGNDLQGDLNTEEWHNFRKKIKILVHVYQFLGGTIAKKIPFNLSYLDDLQDSIGKWHDTMVASVLIKQTVKSAKTPIEKLIREGEIQKAELSDRIQNFKKKATQLQAELL